jgi:hypothetical protein
VGELERLEIVWKGRVVKTVTAAAAATSLIAEAEIDGTESGWVAARAFEKSSPSVRFAHTSPVYVQVGQDRGVVAEDVKFFLIWLDREMAFYKGHQGFRTEADRAAMLDLFRRARTVYVRLMGARAPANH